MPHPIRARTLATACVLAIAGALGVAATAPAEDEAAPGTEALEAVIETRSQGNDQAASVQKRIDSLSDETDELLSQYRTALKQIDSIEVYDEQLLLLIDSQERELASLDEQLDRVQDVSRSVTPLMLKMVDAIEEFVELDVPFLIDERKERTAGLRALMTRADVTTPEKFRQIMEAYQIENEYGRTIEAYRDSLVIEGRESIVDVLRFGRIALVYQSLDGTRTGRWDNEARDWIELDPDLRSAVREGLRIARKQVAPDLVRLPLNAPTDAREVQ